MIDSTTVTALLTCHNRKELTLRCLSTLFSQATPSVSLDLDAVLVDDGSTDNTADAVLESFAAVRVVRGDGSLFWAGGMRLAEATAVTARPDYLLWVNDDVALDSDALDRLLRAAASRSRAIVVGALRDPDSGEITYSGVVRSSWHPLKTRLVLPSDLPLDADTFNGNVVLIPHAVYEAVGPIDGGFSHGQADFDYGLRARNAGFAVVVAPGSIGSCRRGSAHGTFEDTTLALVERWRLVHARTGLPPRSHARYLRRHGGPLWPIYWAAPYVKLAVSALVSAPRRLRSENRRTSGSSGEAP